MPFLKFARLNYGRSTYEVKPDEHLPLPEQFDFTDPEGCARKVYAIMSNASGGHTIRDCKLTYHIGRRTANLSANGVHVFYAPAEKQPLTPEDAERVMNETVALYLGTVRADQYGDGWKRAVWK